MKLYSHPISGHAHRARLFLSLIGAHVEIIEVDLAKGEHKSPDYLAKNRFGQVPLLEDDGAFIPDSNAIMVYAAKKFGRTDWLPDTAEGAAAVQRWLMQPEVWQRRADAAGALIARHQGAAARTLAVVQPHLSARDWDKLVQALDLPA